MNGEIYCPASTDDHKILAATMANTATVASCTIEKGAHVIFLRKTTTEPVPSGTIRCRKCPLFPKDITYSAVTPLSERAGLISDRYLNIITQWRQAQA